MSVQLLPRTKASGVSTALAVVAVLLAWLLSACGSTDRKVQADQLERAIKAMPGVADARLEFTNDAQRGATLKISVNLPDASPQQIADVVARIDKVRGEAFNSFDQTAEFWVTQGHRVRVTRGADLEPAAIAADAERIRRFANAVDASEISISGRQLSTPAGLRVDEVKTPADDVFAAVRAVFGDEAELSLDLAPAANVQMPLWSVSFPFGAEDQQRVEQQIATMPVAIWSITVGPHGEIADLNVGVPNADTAYQDLVSVIQTTGAGPEHALDLGWQLEGQSAFETMQFKGLVDAGGCTYQKSQGELHPEFYLTPTAVELQQRLRSQFDDCPK